MPYADPIVLKEYKAAWHQRNKDRMLGIKNNWRRENPENHREYSKQRADKYRKYMAMHKAMSGCIECGYNENPGRLHYHHIDPSTKLFTVSKGWAHTEESVLREIAKCEILCVSCHGKRNKGGTG